MLPLRARVDLEVMVMKGYSAFHNAPLLLEPHHKIVTIQDARWEEGLTSRQRGCQCILQPQLTGKKEKDQI